MVLEVIDLRKTFRSWKVRRDGPLSMPRWGSQVRAVRGIDLTVRKGEIFGFLGPNGAGKTTTIKMLMGLIRPSGGVMRLFGGSPDELPTRARIGYLPEQPYFYDYLKPAEILDFYARLFRIRRAERKKRTDELIEKVGLGHSRHLRLRQFSKGMLQRVGIASALINDPELVVLDEPLSGLDPIGRKEMRDIIVDLRARGRTVFFSSHILSDIELICDKVAIIEQGRLRALGTLDELLDADQVETEITARQVDDVEALEKAFPGGRVERLGAYVRVHVDESQTTDALRAVLDAGGRVETVTRRRESLEDLFVRSALRPGATIEGSEDEDDDSAAADAAAAGE